MVAEYLLLLRCKAVVDAVVALAIRLVLHREVVAWLPLRLLLPVMAQKKRYIEKSRRYNEHR